MDITQENLTDLNALVKINVKKEDYQKKVDQTVKDYSKKASIKGFRPGKVPTGMIKKMYGDQILAEELNKMVSDELNKYITENKLDILGQPIPKEDKKINLNISQPQDYEFVYELGLAPELDLKILTKSPKVRKYKIKVDSKIVDEEIENLRKRYGSMEAADKPQEDDYLHVEFTELEGGAEKEDGVKNETSVPIDMISAKKVQKEVLNAKAGDKIDIDIFSVFDKEKEQIAKNFLEIDPQQLKNTGSDFRMKIKTFNRIKKAGLNKELFDKIYGEGNVKDEKEFREKIIEDMEKIMENQSEHKFHEDVKDKLLDEIKVPLPDDFLKKWIRLSNEKPITDVQVEEDYEYFSKDLKWSLIVNQVSKKNDIKVEKEEIEDEAKENVRRHFAQYGHETVPEEQVSMMSQQLLQDKEHIRKMHDYLLSEKLFNFLKSKLTIKEKEISRKEFNKLTEK